MSDLPQGAFVYPVERRRSKVPLVIGLLVASAAIGAAAMLLLQREEPTTSAEVVAQQPSPDAGIEPVVSSVDASDPAGDPAIDVDEPPVAVEVTPDAAVAAAPRDAADTRTASASPSRPPRTRVSAAGGTSTNASEPTAKPDPKPDPKPDVPAADPGCDEVACVMEKYARACCARFKPASEPFQPTVGSSENLEKPQIRAGVDKVKPRVIACGEQFTVKGTVKLSITVDGEGSVQELSVQETPDEGLGNCVAAALRKAKFAKTTNGGSFTYPFVF
jgi:hypothetical protein